MNTMADITDSETAELIKAVNERKHVLSELEKQKDKLQQVVERKRNELKLGLIKEREQLDEHISNMRGQLGMLQKTNNALDQV